MATGKNKLIKYARLWVGGYDLSGDARTVESLDYALTELDFTGWNQNIRNFLTDKRPAVAINGLQLFFNDSAVAGSEGAYTVLKQADATVFNTSLVFGGNAEPTYGDPAYVMRGMQFTQQGAQTDGIVLFNSAFKASPNTSEGIPWGQIIYPKTANVAASITAATTVDQNGEINSPLTFPTTYGYKATLHIFATAAGSWSFKIEHSSNGSTWADLANFTINGSAVGSEHIVSNTASVNRYIRFAGTRTAGTITLACVFARNLNAI